MLALDDVLGQLVRIYCGIVTRWESMYFNKSWTLVDPSDTLQSIIRYAY